MMSRSWQTFFEKQLMRGYLIEKAMLMIAIGVFCLSVGYLAGLGQRTYYVQSDVSTTGLRITSGENTQESEFLSKKKEGHLLFRAAKN